ncbi:MAG: HDOD domain-containing protein, partial [Desulfobacula sp.]|nr:HDOD domain-containing protein [Desulfobacula sp.]
SLYAKIISELQSPDASAASVGEIIAKDMGMTAKVLQLVNSSFFGMPRHISNVQEAVVLLGIDIVKTLVLGIEVFSRFSKNALSIIPVDKIHDHCVKTGVIAKKIAKLEKMDKEKTDNAMIASSLHDLGKLILVEHYPDDYKGVMEVVRQKKMPVFKAESQIFGVTHGEVGAYLLGLWGLPENIIEGIAFHHNPAKISTREFELCGLVHVAELMEHHEQLQPGGWEKLNGLDTKYMENIGLLDKIPLWRDYLRIK